MKAACLLLCIALARLGAASIFHRRHYPTMDNYVVESADYIDPYLQEQHQRQQQYRPQQYRQQYLQDEAQLNRDLPQAYAPWNQAYSQQNQVQEQRQAYGQRKQAYGQKNQVYNQRNQEYVQTQGRQNQMENQYRQEQDQQKKHNVHYQAQDQQVYGNQLRRQEPETIRSRFADTSDMGSGSQEDFQAQHVLNNQYEQNYAAPVFADIDTPKAVSFAAEIAEPVVYGDAVAWRGLQVASGPNTPVNKKDIEKIFRSAQKATKHILPETKSELHMAVEVAAKESEDARLNATELLKKYQYPVEEHTIQTEDGYYLTLFRIPPKQKSTEQNTKVVFLMHGLLGSADDWLLMGPGKSLAYLLSDAGYDVFLGNARCSKYARHASKHQAQPDYWQHSNDEIALYDLPAMIDFVLRETKQQKMIYVGHSLGTTTLFALLAARPTYNDKIEMMYALSPMVYMSRVRSPLVRMIAPSSPFYERLNLQFGNGEFKPTKEVVSTIGGNMCENEIGCKHMCSNVYFVMAGVNAENLEPSQIPTIMGHLPAGGSTKQMKHYGQAVDSNEFRRYDYGSEMNMKVYGQSRPPKYNMENVSAPVVLYYSEHDWLAHPTDVERLRKELPNATAHKIPQDYFSHIDYQFSKQAPEMVNKNLIESIQKHQINMQQNSNEQQ